MLLIRSPAAAGTFYNLSPELLREQIERCFKHKFGPKTIKKQKFFGAIVPHAGYEFSGPVAAWIYSKIESGNYIIIGPNHHGTGARFAIMKRGLWKTPLGEIAIKEDMAEKILERCKIVEQDILAHQYEHSIEVQLPFLQYRFGSDFKFVPLCILNEYPDETLLEACKLIGKGIGEVLKKEKERWIILASSDFSHYIPQEEAKKIDRYVIKAILKLDEKDFFSRIEEKAASICGFGPIAIAMVAAKELGAKKVELLSYKTSGDITSDFGAVVGYGSLIFV